MKTKKKLTKSEISKIIEITWLSVLGSIWLMGFIFGILGLVVNYVTPVSTNPINLGQKHFGSLLGLNKVDFLLFGIIIMVIAVIGIVIVLYYYSNKQENIKLTKERRDKLMQEFLASNAFTANNEGAAPEQGTETK